MSQKQRILAYLKSGNSLTQASAIQLFRCYRLSERIREIEGMGIKIKHVSEPNTWNTGRHTRYFMEIQQ